MDVCCGEPLEPENAIKPKPHGRLGCGKRNVDGVGFRITGNVNNEAQFGEFPWMVRFKSLCSLYGNTHDFPRQILQMQLVKLL